MYLNVLDLFHWPFMSLTLRLILKVILIVSKISSVACRWVFNPYLVIKKSAGEQNIRPSICQLALGVPCYTTNILIKWHKGIKRIFMVSDKPLLYPAVQHFTCGTRRAHIMNTLVLITDNFAIKKSTKLKSEKTFSAIGFSIFPGFSFQRKH